MNNYVDNGVVSTTGTGLPGTKSNVATPTPVPANMSLSSTEANSLSGALTDLKTVVTRSVSIMSYGADPTGATDSSTALANAMTAAAAGTGVGIVYLPTGTYRLSASKTVPTNVTLAFQSSSVSIDNGVTLQVFGAIAAPSLAIFSWHASPSAQPILFYGTSQRVNAMWFGADPTFSTDSTAALTICMNSMRGTEISVPGAGTLYSAPTIFIPVGRYLLSGTLPLPTGNIEGDNAILDLQASTTTDFFTTGALFQAGVKGLSFAGGQNVFNLSCNNTSATFWGDDLKFFNNNGACILTDATCGNLTINFANCLAENNISGSTILTNGSATVNLINWAGSHGGTTIFNLLGGTLYADLMNLAPQTGGGQHIYVQAGSCSFKRSRFGGEAEKTIVKWTAPLLPADLYAPNTIVDNFLIFEDNQVYSDGSGGPDFAFYTLPLMLRFAGNTGIQLGSGIYFDSTIPLDQRQAVRSIFNTELTLGQKNRVDNTSDPELMDRYFGAPIVVSDGTAAVNRYVRQFAASSNVYGLTASATGATITTGTDAFGVGQEIWTAGGSGGGGYLSFGTVLAGLAAGAYTLRVAFQALSQGLQTVITVAGFNRQVFLPAGNSVVDIPFYKGFTDPAAWATATGYVAGNKIVSSDGSNIFYCLFAGTSKSSGGGPTGGQPGQVIADSTLSTTIASASNNVPLPTASIAVASTTGFASSGTIQVLFAAGEGEVSTYNTIAYTSKDSTHFLGCTGGGTNGEILQTGDVVIQTGTIWEWVGNLAVKVNPSLPANAVMKFSRISIITGHPDGGGKQNAILQDTAAPTQSPGNSGSSAWFVGDTVENTVPAAGGVIGYVCTASAAGAAGTWKPFGNISS